MARTLERVERRAETQGSIVAAHDLQLVEMTRKEASRSEHRWGLYVAAVTVVLGEIGQIVALILFARGKA